MSGSEISDKLKQYLELDQKLVDSYQHETKFIGDNVDKRILFISRRQMLFTSAMVNIITLMANQLEKSNDDGGSVSGRIIGQSSG